MPAAYRLPTGLPPSLFSHALDVSLGAIFPPFRLKMIAQGDRVCRTVISSFTGCHGAASERQNPLTVWGVIGRIPWEVAQLRGYARRLFNPTAQSSRSDYRKIIAGVVEKRDGACIRAGVWRADPVAETPSLTLSTYTQIRVTHATKRILTRLCSVSGMTKQ